MKRILCLALVLAALLSLFACGKKAAEPSEGDTLSLSDIMDKIQDGATDIPATASTELNAENFEFYLFIPYIDGAEALAGDALISAIPHSVVLLRTPDGVDAEKTTASIRENANPGKWICVTAEKTEVVCHGSTILLVMSAENTANDIVASFNALWDNK